MRRRSRASATHPEIGPPFFLVLSFLFLIAGGAIWLIRLILLLTRRRWSSLGYMGVPLGVFALLAFAASHFQAGEIERAKIIGDTVLERILAFEQGTGAFPDTLEDLSAFDSMEIPSSGVGILNLGGQEFQWMKSLGALSFQGFEGNTHMSLGIQDWTSVKEMSAVFDSAEAATRNGAD